MISENPKTPEIIIPNTEWKAVHNQDLLLKAPENMD